MGGTVSSLFKRVLIHGMRETIAIIAINVIITSTNKNKKWKKLVIKSSNNERDTYYKTETLISLNDLNNVQRQSAVGRKAILVHLT